MTRSTIIALLVLAAHNILSAQPIETLNGQALAPGHAVVPEIAVAPMRPPLSELMRPTFAFAAESLTIDRLIPRGSAGQDVSDIELLSYDAKVTIPTYPFFGPPPPMVSFGFSYTDLNAASSFNLPTDLYDYSLGVAWMRRINDRWMARFMFSTAYASDGNNNSSDAWQFRGGAFAMYQRSPAWTWIFGVVVLGRNDLPAVPAVGVIWQPKHDFRMELTMPKPRLAWLLSDTGDRQQWGYIGAGLGGGTWGFQQPGGVDDQVTYGDWRAMIGWEAVPKPPPGIPFARGRKFSIEAGYAFSRDFEFESGRPDIDLPNSWMLRATVGF